MSASNWTGRTPHTLNEAFGAHCNESISAQHEPMEAADKLFCWVMGAIGLAAVALMFAGVIV